MNSETENKLPALSADYDDGWNDVELDDRVIQGTLIKCVDGHWSTKDGTAPPKQLLALATTTVLQLWDNKMPVETIVKRPGQPWPDIDELNAKIPEENWEIGLDGNPRAPWQKQFVVYLLDLVSAAKFTFANGTVGARIAVSNLKDQIKWMRAMRGDNVVPLIELASKPMKTKFGQKLRPDFKAVEWRNLGVSLTKETTPQVVAPVSTQEALDEEGHRQ
jgi:hypothetical protein